MSLNRASDNKITLIQGFKHSPLKTLTAMGLNPMQAPASSTRIGVSMVRTTMKTLMMTTYLAHECCRV